MPDTTAPEQLREPQHNALLRRADWRFLLRLAEEPGDADLIALKRPTRAELRKAFAELRPGGEIHCEWRLSLPGGIRRARRTLEKAGFEDIRIHWPWPPPGRSSPHFWLPLDSPAARAHLFALRPGRDWRDAAMRRLWRAAVAIGVVAPLSAVARRPGAVPEEGEEIESRLDALTGSARSTPRSWLLLTGGKRSINKVVGIPFEGKQEPQVVVKFARVPEAERGLRREAEVLQALEVECPAVPGVPRVLASGRRVGRLALAETAIHGTPLLSSLSPETFPRLAMDVTRWLVSLAGISPPHPRASWWPRLVEAPLGEFEQRFDAVADAGTAERARKLLEGLPDLPLVCEHRDCSPWNVVLTGAAEPALLDWESAEPRGLPGLDLVYLLANAAFVIEGALESGRTREAYGRLLDPATPHGQVFASCVSEYCDRLRLDPETFARLRSLCWIVHSHSDYRHLEMDANAPPDPGALGASVFLGLLHEDLSRLEETP